MCKSAGFTVRNRVSYIAMTSPPSGTSPHTRIHCGCRGAGQGHRASRGGEHEPPLPQFAPVFFFWPVHDSAVRAVSLSGPLLHR